MTRILMALAALCLLSVPLKAQEQDSVFSSYSALYSYVDTHMARRDFIPLIQRLGGRDEYTVEQLNGVQNQFNSIYRQNFQHRGQVRVRNLENGFKEEVVAYWTGTAYIWLYMFTHQRADTVLVVSFTINSSAEPVMSKM